MTEQQKDSLNDWTDVKVNDEKVIGASNSMMQSAGYNTLFRSGKYLQSRPTDFQGDADHFSAIGEVRISW